MNTNVLVIGGAGYVGCVLVEELLSTGHHVTVVDDFRMGRSGLLHLNSKNLQIFNLDIRDFSKYEHIITESDFIVPLAALVGAPLCDQRPFEARSINYEAVVKLESIRTNNQKIIYPTTNSGYGTKSGEVSCDEATKLEPISLYGETKVMCENYLLQKNNVVSLRFATAFGVSPNMRTDLLVNDFVTQAIEVGVITLYEEHFKRNFIHVRDMAKAIVFTMKNFKEMSGESYNCGISNCNLSKLELAHKIKEYIPNLKIELSDFGYDPDKRNYIVSNEKIEKAGFQTQYSLDDGISELVRMYPLFASKRSPA